ncbi:CPBP family intramembrane glutamic endopeptidase [Companilactobacillus zhongbaensis]|uniref:CPBP family intramembrane glutamic endopeptidase n=1 Tax=Companilactobacillus zhongbaensis TaxID=2486009 RepID=UPI000F76FC2B|nr:CPBP family intramembrane glutamic endopeptidase [Companilactobacillus zhongbaensis]
MLKTNSVQHRLFYTQLVLNSTIILFFAIFKSFTAFELIIVVNFLGLLIHDKPDGSKFDKVNRLLQLLVQPFLIPLAVNQLIILTQESIDWQNPALLAIVLLYASIMYIPYTYVVIAPLKNIIARIAIIIYSFLFPASTSLDQITGSTIINSNKLIRLLSDTMFSAAIIIVVMLLVMMIQWQQHLPRVKKLPSSNWWIIIAIIIFTVWFAMWNAFSNGDSLIAFNFSHLKITWSSTLGGLEAGIAEEFIFRYAILTLLLNYLYNRRNRTYYAAIISSLLFAALHGSNALAGQDLGNTTIQIIFAFALGFYFAAIYIYTNNFYLVVFFHSLLDILVFYTTDTQLMTGKVTTADIFGTVIESTVFVIIAVLILAKHQDEQTKRNLHFY